MRDAIVVSVAFAGRDFLGIVKFFVNCSRPWFFFRWVGSLIANIVNSSLLYIIDLKIFEGNSTELKTRFFGFTVQNAKQYTIAPIVI